MSCIPGREVHPHPERWETLSAIEVPPIRDGPPQTKPLTLMNSILGECLCGPFAPWDMKGLSPSAQFIELHGIQFIGLGAVMDELTAKERVYDTLEQLSSRTERLISIGYLVDDDKHAGKMTEAIPLDIWSKTYPDDKSMSRAVKRTIASIKVKDLSTIARNRCYLLL
jgi:hypothetical protein